MLPVRTLCVPRSDVSVPFFSPVSVKNSVLTVTSSNRVLSSYVNAVSASIWAR